MRHSLRLVVLALVLFFTAVCLSSCSKGADGSSFLSQLDTVDSFINQSQTSDALKYLKKAEKGAFSAYARLGIYKRYLMLGETKSAEKVLQKALKSLPENPELTAAYAHFLLRQERGAEALEVAKSLEGGKYGSLYSEAVLRRYDIRSGAMNLEEFLDEKLASIYYGAFTGTNDAQWLRDSALIYLAQGDYAGAASLQSEVQDSRDAIFWGLVQYDAGAWDLCLKNLAFARDEAFASQRALLASDVYVQLNDEDAAEKERSHLLLLHEGNKELEVPANVLVNSALWSRRHGDFRRAYDLILEAVTDHADFVPSLLTYAKMAWDDAQPVEMTALEKSVRATELRTAAMAKIDARPKILLEDAVYRLKKESEREQKEVAVCDERLETLLLILSIKMDERITRTKKLALLWEALEKNELGKNLYPPLLVQYCVHELGHQGHGEEARTLFENYLNARYHLEPVEDSEKDEGEKTDIFGGVILNTAQAIPESVVKQAFTNRAAGDVHDLEIWEGETAAYFALLDENVTAARRLYEYVLFETGGGHVEGERIESISTLASTASAVNLAMVYSSLGEKEKALSLYRLAFGVAEDRTEKSMILYRTALIQDELGDMRGALLTLEYSLALNPMNVDAKLLKRKLEK